MSPTLSKHDIPVTDVDQAFPTLTTDLGAYTDRRGGSDVATPVRAAIRDVLGLRPRVEDPKAFNDALRAAFRLRLVEGHVVSEYVPRGYAVQADLGAVTGGQASLYRRAQVLRTEVLRILDGLTPLRTDADREDMEAYRSLVRNAVSAVVDELGAAGGPRLEMVDSYLLALTGSAQPAADTTPDTVGGQLGALRDRFGLLDQFVNTVEEEGVRTSFWTLADMVGDLQSSFLAQRGHFGSAAGRGFLGTELILLSRLMEAAADQVDELEAILDSVLVGLAERRTLVLDPDTGLTLDGLLGWLRVFLTREGRLIAQDTGRDGIVTALAPTAAKLLTVFHKTLADRVEAQSPAQDGAMTRLLSTSPKAKLPAGLCAARSRIAVASLSRLLLDLARSTQRIGRWPGVVLVDVVVRRLHGRSGVVEVILRGINLQPVHVPVFVAKPSAVRNGHQPVRLKAKDMIRALPDTTTADGDTLTALFDLAKVQELLPEVDLGDDLLLPAEGLPIDLLDIVTGQRVLTLDTTPIESIGPVDAAALTDDDSMASLAELASGFDPGRRGRAADRVIAAEVALTNQERKATRLAAKVDSARRDNADAEEELRLAKDQAQAVAPEDREAFDVRLAGLRAEAVRTAAHLTSATDQRDDAERVRTELESGLNSAMAERREAHEEAELLMSRTLDVMRSN